MGTMQFVSGATSITVNRPLYGYEVGYHLPITIQEKHPVGYAIPFFDAASAGTYDYRTVSFRPQFTATQQTDFTDFFRSASLGRCQTVTLSLGVTATGFCPAGPDKGDVGDFTVRLLSWIPSGSLLAPWRHFENTLQFAIVTAPAYALPAQVAQGGLDIGSVQDLLFPQDAFKPEPRYVWRTDLSMNGTPYSIDGLRASDTWESAWDQQLNQSKAAALMAYLVSSSGRASDITIIAPSYSYMFGIDQGSGGSYLTKFLGSERTDEGIIIRARHDRYNRWTVPLRFLFISKVGTGYQDTEGAAVKWMDTFGATTKYQDGV